MFQELPFYNTFIETAHIKRFKNKNLLCELLFHNELRIEKMSKALKIYARSYKIKIIDSKHPSAKLTTSKRSINDLFKDLLDQIKGFKCQITVKFLLRKYKLNRDLEFVPVNSNSTTKTIINPKYNLHKSFQ